MNNRDLLSRFKAMRDELNTLIDELESQTSSERDWVTQREASQLLGVCDSTVSNWVRGGRFLPEDISFIGKKVYVNRKAIENRRFNH